MMNNKLFRLLLTFLSGIILSLAWSDYHLGLLACVGFVPLLFIAERYRSQNMSYSSPAIFFYAYLGFFVFNTLSTWWIWNSSVFGAIMALFFNSLFMSIVFWLYFIISRRTGKRTGFWAFVILWLGFEYLHLNWDLSWTWLTLGNAFSGNISLVQWYEYTGVLGGSLWVLIINIIVFLAIESLIARNRKKTFIWFATLDTILFIPLAISLLMYYSYEEKGKPVEVVVVQPNIDPYHEKFGGMSMSDQLMRFRDLAERSITPETRFIIGPETALPDGLWEESMVESAEFQFLMEIIHKHKNLSIITGLSSYRELKPSEEISLAARKFKGEDGYYENFNTALYADSNGIPYFYHKSKLVLGVEKMPFPKTLSFLHDFIIDLGGTTGTLGYQEERSVFSTPDSIYRPAPVICYESIYGEFVTGYIRKGANLIFVITNDGWWGNTQGYRQHLRMSSLRAIETRRSIARSANTGISCFINQRGDIISPTQYWIPDALNGTINTNEEITFYVKFGDYIGRFAGFLSALVILYYLSLKLMKKKFGTL
jgi:apolipoprotein N-acyltransferase